MKEAVMKVIDTLTQEDFDRAFQKLLERYNKCIAAGGDYLFHILKKRAKDLQPGRKDNGDILHSLSTYICRLVRKN